MKKKLIIFFLIFFTTNIYADNKVLYLDINFLLNTSTAGKFLNKELKNIQNKNLEELKKIENSIKLEDDKLAKQKNIIKEDEYKAKVVELRSEYKSFQELVKKKNNNLNKIRENGVNQILNAINELLTDYSSKNNISLIVDKKNIIIGKTELDVTNIILDLLNKKIKKVDL
mgnify:CR=1 FL=1